MTSEWKWFAGLGMVTLAAASLAACGDGTLFREGGAAAGGSGASSSSATTSNNTAVTNASSAEASSSSSDASSGAGGNMCGDGVCDPGETMNNCPQDCTVCTHSLCEVGDALQPSCDPCVQQVCNNDFNCCDNNWDNDCIALADQLCGTGCCGNGMCEGQNCISCEADCGTCVCGDANCLGEDCSTCAADCGDCPTCGHTVCQAGGPLTTMQCPDPCVDAVCMQQPSCCNVAPFNGVCQQLAVSLCGGGDPCVNAVCAQHPSCCSNTWDAFCVSESAIICQVGCDCAHAPCDTGPLLDAACDPCVAEICNADPYCCDNGWDGLCVGEMATVCGVACGP